MNVYQKLNAAREKFHQAKLKKSGHNKFAGYSYFELSDFVVPALQIFNEVGLCSTISFCKEYADMRIVNVDKPEEVITFTSPMSEANLKGCHAVQNLGAVETYTRRYLWVAALEIVEHDALDSSEPIKEEKKITKIVPVRHSPVPDVELDKESRERVEEIVTDIILACEEGRELDAVELYYHVITDNEEKLTAWKMLGPHSKIRSFLRANKPQPVAA